MGCVYVPSRWSQTTMHGSAIAAQICNLLLQHTKSHPYFVHNITLYPRMTTVFHFRETKQNVPWLLFFFTWTLAVAEKILRISELSMFLASSRRFSPPSTAIELVMRTPQRREPPAPWGKKRDAVRETYLLLGSHMHSFPFANVTLKCDASQDPPLLCGAGEGAGNGLIREGVLRGCRHTIQHKQL
jgi:hypothetical protein